MCSHIGTNQQICLSAVSSHNCCDSWRWGLHVLQGLGFEDWKCPEVSTCFRLNHHDWQESVANRQLECNPSEWQVRTSIVIIQLLLGKESESFLQLVHELAGPSDLRTCILTSFLCSTLLWQHSSISGKRVSIKRVDFSIRKLASVWPVWPFIISPGIAGMPWHHVRHCSSATCTFFHREDSETREQFSQMIGWREGACCDKRLRLSLLAFFAYWTILIV